MRALDRKLLRDLWHLRGPAVAVAVVAACGVAAFVTMRSMVYHLGESQASYYQEGRFADVFARVRRAPEAAGRALHEIPGVAALELRVTGDIVLDVPGLAEPANAHVVGTRFNAPDALNRVVVNAGRTPVPDARDEIMVSEGFALANHLEPNDVVGGVLNGRRRALRIVGIGLSPEFIYEFQAGSVFPDNRHFGVIWMDREVAAQYFGMGGAFNDASLALAPGASEPAVLAAVDRVLERYGAPGAHGRDRHASHRFLSEEIRQNREFATIIPVIFLGVAAFLVHLVLSRIVISQREQVGMLKAYGHSNAMLARHYILMALVPTLSGAVLGDLVGWRTALGAARMYQDFFRFPHLNFHIRPGVLAFGGVASAVAAALGAMGAVRRVAKLPPAQAMRPEAPIRFAPGLMERLRVTTQLSPVARMTARSLLRRPVRSALSILGLALGVSVVIVGGFGFDAIRMIRRVQFDLAERADVSTTFTAVRERDAINELRRLPGVWRVEPVRETAVRLRHAHQSRHVALVAVATDATLRRVVDLEGRVLAASAAGATLSHPLAALLDLRVGDTVDVEFREGKRERHRLPVVAFSDDLLGTSLYVTVGEWTRMRGGTDAITGAVLGVEPGHLADVYALLKLMPGILAVGSRAAMRGNFDATVAKSFRITLGSLLFFAGALCVGVVYNTARIALAERGRELASLRVLGFNRGEVARMLFGEQLVLALVALPVGAALGAAFAWMTVASLGNTELFRMPLVIGLRTYLASFAVLGVAGLASAILVRHRLDRLDLVAVLKTRE